MGVEKNKVHEFYRRELESSLPCCFGRTMSNIQQGACCVFLTSDELNECIFPHRRQHLLLLQAISLSCRSHKATNLFLFHFQSAAGAAVSRLVQDNSRKQGVCSLSPGYTPHQVLIGGGLGARCYSKVQFTMTGTLLGNGESFTPENEVSVGVATFQPCTLGPDWPSLTSQAQISLL